jgi:predicted mannosyl-3-phosphoglycerate phosphatase (HAD superfamily)
MNAPMLNELRNGLPARDLADEKMAQVRELLIGDFVRTSEVRMMAMETRIRDLETGFAQRLTSINHQLDALHHKVETMATDHTLDRQAAFDELAKSVLDLGDRIRMIPR